MKISNAIAIAVMAAATLLGGTAGAQKATAVPGGNFYFNDYEWPLPAERTTTMTLNGMKSVHAVILSFTRYAETNPVQDQPILTILEGSTVKWTPPQGCPYDLQLVNSNPPVINMTKQPGMCNLKNGAKVILRILAMP